MTSEPFDGADPTNAGSLGDRLDDLLIRAEDWVARSRIAIVASLAITLAGAVAWWAVATPGRQPPVEETIPLAGTTSVPPAAASGAVVQVAPDLDVSDGADGAAGLVASGTPDHDDEADQELVVHVIGAVARPGLVVLAHGDRISDAVDAAGGAEPDADLERLNLATPLVDGMQIRVPVRDEQPDDDVERPLVQLPATGGPSGGGLGNGAGAGVTVSEPVDLNRADEVELQQLPGIGPALAGRIVAWRAENGGFASVDELEAVPGIGPATMADLRELITV